MGNPLENYSQPQRSYYVNESTRGKRTLIRYVIFGSTLVEFSNTFQMDAENFRNILFSLVNNASHIFHIYKTSSQWM